MAAKSLKKVNVNLDAKFEGGEYSEYYDCNAVSMAPVSWETESSFKKTVSVNTKTLEASESFSEENISYLEFSMGFWLTEQLFVKGKKCIEYIESGTSVFSVDLSDLEAQQQFNKFCKEDPTYGVAKFIWWAFDNNKYEPIKAD